MVFHLVLLHVAYFLFLHYTQSFHRVPPAPDWFRLPFLVMRLTVVGLQMAVFWLTVRRRTRSTGAGRPSKHAVPAS